MNKPQLILIDSDEHAAERIFAELIGGGLTECHRVDGATALTLAASGQADIVLFNDHYAQPEAIEICLRLREVSPTTTVIVLTSSGPASRRIRAWADTHRAVDLVLEKPLPEGSLLRAVTQAIAQQRSARTLRHVERLVPEGALAAIEGPDVSVFPAAVLFTDIRRSTEVITQHSPRAFFGMLNASLSAQTALIKTFKGEIVKYTGDGVMAVFRGMGRSYLAARCALELAGSEAQQSLGFGIGVAEGLVLSGFVGDFGASGQRQQYDVIGATAHLAARLCHLATPGEAIMTQSVHKASRLSMTSARDVGAIEVRGFAEPVACVAIGIGSAQEIGG